MGFATLAGIGTGIDSGTTNAMRNTLNAASLGIRKQRNEALEGIADRRLTIEEEKLTLEQNKFSPTNAQLQEEFETKQERNQLLLAKEKAEKAASLELEAEKSDWQPMENLLAKQWGEDGYTPDQPKAMANLIEQVLPGQSRDGLYTTEIWNRTMAAITDPKNPAPGGRDGLKKVFRIGATQTNNKMESNKAKLEKLFEKDPLLANPEYLKGDEKALQLSESIPDLEKGTQTFRQADVEVDQFFEQQKQTMLEDRNRELERIKTIFEDRISGQETAQKARETAETFTPEIRSQLADIGEDLRKVSIDEGREITNETERRELQFLLLQEAMGLVSAEDQNKVIKFLRPFAPDAEAEFLSR